jgi:hypothetical protein
MDGGKGRKERVSRRRGLFSSSIGFSACSIGRWDVGRGTSLHLPETRVLESSLRRGYDRGLEKCL